MAFFRLSNKSDRSVKNDTNDHSNLKGQRRRHSLKRKRASSDRRSQLETLERRELLAAEVLDIDRHAIFTADTPQSVVDEYEAKTHFHDDHDDEDGLTSPILQGTRWRNSVLGAGDENGDPAGLTWSIVPDGTTVVDPQGNDPDANSNLVSFLDDLYGDGGATTDDFTQRPWFRLIERAYDSWAAVSGLTLQYEPVDDGADVAAGGSIGIDGVRGDLRVSGYVFDSAVIPDGVLAFNYFPNGGGLTGSDGDMVFDTGDGFYARNADPAEGENRAIHNVFTHEVGHGIGIAHVLPVNGTKLMEPFVNLSFFGVQEDDIYNANELYGDNFESNNTLATPTDLGVLQNELAEITGASIARDSDADFYRFEVLTPTVFAASLIPTGNEYLEGPQFGGAASLVNRRTEADLGLRILDADGNVIQEIDAAAAGATENLNQIDLPAAGTYFAEVFGDGDTQIYDLQLRVGRTFGFNPQAGDLRLVSVNPNADELFDRDEINVLATSPTELTFRFSTDSSIDESSLAGGIRITGAGRDQVSGTPDDVTITPGWIGFGETDKIVIARFAEPLADSRYRVEVFGVDLPDEGITALRETDGGLFQAV